MLQIDRKAMRSPAYLLSVWRVGFVHGAWLTRWSLLTDWLFSYTEIWVTFLLKISHDHTCSLVLLGRAVIIINSIYKCCIVSLHVIFSTSDVSPRSFSQLYAPICQFLLQTLGSRRRQETEVSSLNQAARWHFGSTPCRVLSEDFWVSDISSISFQPRAAKTLNVFEPNGYLFVE